MIDHISDKIHQNEDVPEFIRTEFFKTRPETSDEFYAEKTLWREVVARIIMDCLSKTGVSKPRLHDSIIRSARLFLKFDSEGVQYVLDNAGLRLKEKQFRTELLKIEPLWRDNK